MYPDFSRLWVAQTVSQLGSRVSMFTFPLVAYALTGSTLLAGLAGATELLGMAVVLLPAGVLADRVDRRLLMRTAAGAGLLLYASLAAAALLGALTLPHLLVVGVLTGAAAGLTAPAEIAAVRTVVPADRLPTALSHLQARGRIADLGGGPLGGALYGVARWAPFVLDTLSFALAWVLLGRLRTDLSPTPRDDRRSAWQDVAEGFKFVWRQPLFRTLMVWGMGANLVVNALFTAANLRLVQAGYPAWQIGLVDTAAGACGLLGALAAPALIARFPTGRLTVAVAWSFVPLLVPLIFWNHPVVVAAALAVGVFLNPAGNAGIGSYRIAVTPDALIGRVQSVSQFTSWSTLPLAPVLGGGLLALVGGPATMALLAGLVAVVALIPTLARSVRSVPRPVEWPRAGGRQCLPAGPEAGPESEGSAGRPLEPAGAAAGHP